MENKVLNQASGRFLDGPPREGRIHQYRMKSNAQITLDDVDKESTFIRTFPTLPQDLSLHFCKPESVHIIGSYAEKSRTTFPMTVDLCLVLPSVAIFSVSP